MHLDFFRSSIFFRKKVVISRERYLRARSMVDAAIRGWIPSRLAPSELAARANALRNSPEYVEAVSGSGMGIWPLVIGAGVVAAGAATYKGFAWAAAREERLLCEANPDACPGTSWRWLPLAGLGVLGLGAWYYVRTGKLPLVG